MQKLKRVYRCEDSVDGILSAVFVAGLYGYGDESVKICPIIRGESEDLALFTEYITVESDSRKSESILDAVREQISEEAYYFVLKTVISCYEDRGDAIYQFVSHGFSMGANVCSAMQLPCVQRIFEIQRAVSNESRFWLEFMRFQEIEKKPPVLMAVFEPRHRVVSNVAEHFADRLSGENFIIYDKVHGEAAFHRASGYWEVRHLTEEEAAQLEHMEGEKEEEYVDLWHVFFENIAIAERTNHKLQTSLLPLHYRRHMTEFCGESQQRVRYLRTF